MRLRRFLMREPMRPTTLPGSCGAAPSRRSGRNCRGAGFVTCHAGSVTDTLRAQGIHQRFGDRVVLDGVDLEVPSGRVVGLLGPNGAGKTTLMRVLFGVPQPDAGRSEERRGGKEGDRTCRSRGSR